MLVPALLCIALNSWPTLSLDASGFAARSFRSKATRTTAPTAQTGGSIEGIWNNIMNSTKGYGGGSPNPRAGRVFVSDTNDFHRTWNTERAPPAAPPTAAISRTAARRAGRAPSPYSVSDSNAYRTWNTARAPPGFQEPPVANGRKVLPMGSANGYRAEPSTPDPRGASQAGRAPRPVISRGRDSVRSGQQGSPGFVGNFDVTTNDMQRTWNIKRSPRPAPPASATRASDGRTVLPTGVTKGYGAESSVSRPRASQAGRVFVSDTNDFHRTWNTELPPPPPTRATGGRNVVPKGSLNGYGAESSMPDRVVRDGRKVLSKGSANGYGAESSMPDTRVRFDSRSGQDSARSSQQGSSGLLGNLDLSGGYNSKRAMNAARAPPAAYKRGTIMNGARTPQSSTPRGPIESERQGTQGSFSSLPGVAEVQRLFREKLLGEHDHKSY